MRIWVDIMQSHPNAKFTQCLCQLGHSRLDRPAIPEAAAIFEIDPVSTRILRNDQQLIDTCVYEIFRFVHHITDRTADKIPPHGRNDAEATTMIAPLRSEEHTSELQ